MCRQTHVCCCASTAHISSSTQGRNLFQGAACNSVLTGLSSKASMPMLATEQNPFNATGPHLCSWLSKALPQMVVGSMQGDWCSCNPTMMPNRCICCIYLITPMDDPSCLHILTLIHIHTHMHQHAKTQTLARTCARQTMTQQRTTTPSLHPFNFPMNPSNCPMNSHSMHYLCWLLGCCSCTCCPWHSSCFGSTAGQQTQNSVRAGRQYTDRQQWIQTWQ